MQCVRNRGIKSKTVILPVVRTVDQRCRRSGFAPSDCPARSSGSLPASVWGPSRSGSRRGSEEVLGSEVCWWRQGRAAPSLQTGFRLGADVVAHCGRRTREFELRLQWQESLRTLEPGTRWMAVRPIVAHCKRSSPRAEVSMPTWHGSLMVVWRPIVAHCGRGSPRAEVAMPTWPMAGQKHAGWL